MSPRRVKIVCTIGPACQDRDILNDMLEAGMDVARFNMSHGSYDEHAATIRILRDLASRRERPLALMQDLSGPKIRLGTLEQPLQVRRGDFLRLIEGECAASTGTLPVNYAGLAGQISAGDRLSLADGTFQLRVLKISAGSVETEVIEGNGILTSHKGVNLPDSGREPVALTEKDRNDLRFGLKQPFDWIALSFVHSAEDARRVRAIMDEEGRRLPLLAKIEKPQALKRIEEIVERFDGLMVARGDLGVETSLVQVPGIQKDLIRRANRAAKPVITATQMLLSMVSNPHPTRAEVADVTAAVLDGTDAVMLSEETAQGEHPVEAVRTLADICEEAEKLRQPGTPWIDVGEGTLTPSEGISRIVPRLSEMTGARMIVAPTASGATARRVSSARPKIPILALSSSDEVVRMLALVWGVAAREIGEASDTDELFASARREALATGLVSQGDRVIMTAGSHGSEDGATDLIKVDTL